jgi:hypothetical protein
MDVSCVAGAIERLASPVDARIDTEAAIVDEHSVARDLDPGCGIVDRLKAVGMEYSAAPDGCELRGDSSE